VPLGRFPSVPVDIDGVSTLADFEVIEIIDDSNPYLALLGIEWEIDNYAVINLKNRQIIFEGKGLRFIVLLTLLKEERYTNPVRDEIKMFWIISTASQLKKKEKKKKNKIKIIKRNRRKKKEN